MSGLKRAAGAYLVIIAVVVAIYFAVNPFLVNSIGADSVEDIWLVFDVLMLIGLVVGLIYNYSRKLAVDKDAGQGLSRAYFEANTAFFVTAGVTILFLHNWFSLLSGVPLGAPHDGNHQAWLIWAAVDTILPIVLGITGCHAWRNAANQ